MQINRDEDLLSMGGFQSIGVTKDWRPPSGGGLWLEVSYWFPINRRHQGLATGKVEAFYFALGDSEFPINRRHQGLATMQTDLTGANFFNPCFQSIGVTKDWRRLKATKDPQERHVVSNQ